MGADASVYALSLLAVGRSTTRKRRLAATSGYLQLGLAVVGLAAVVRRVLVDAEPPDVAAMVVMSLLALAGNVATIVVLRRVRSSDAHIQASWIFTANDIKVNLLVIVGRSSGRRDGLRFPGSRRRRRHLRHRRQRRAPHSPHQPRVTTGAILRSGRRLSIERTG
jgi:hypothetical protein